MDDFMKWRNVFSLVALAFFGLFAYLLLNGKDGQWLALFAATLSLVGSRFQDILKLKLGKDGLEADMREVIDEAKASISQLQLLAEELSKVILHSNQAQGRWGSSLDADRMRGIVLGALERLDITPARVAAVKAVEYPFIQFDYSQFVAKGLDQGLSQDQQKAWNEFYSHDRRKGIGTEPSPDELEEFLRSIGKFDQNASEKLADYRHFVERKEHRRPEAWRRRNER